MKFKATMISSLFIVAVVYAAVEADNSGINKRDGKNNYQSTADKHGTSSSDIKISGMIRQSLVSDNALSINAQNVKIITVNGQVTLKGPVKSKLEHDQLTEKAKKITGVSKVINQTEILAQ